MSNNPQNTTVVIGRLAADPKVFPNRDGSKKVSLTMYAKNNFTNSAGERASKQVTAEQFVPATTDYSTTPFAMMHQGDLISVSGELDTNKFTKSFKTVRFAEGPFAGQVVKDANGNPLRVAADVYEQKLEIDSVVMLESKTVTTARQAQHVTAQNAPAQTAAAQPAQPVQSQGFSQPVAQPQPAAQHVANQGDAGFTGFSDAPAPAQAPAQPQAPVAAPAYVEPPVFG